MKSKYLFLSYNSIIGAPLSISIDKQLSFAANIFSALKKLYQQGFSFAVILDLKSRTAYKEKLHFFNEILSVETLPKINTFLEFDERLLENLLLMARDQNIDLMHSVFVDTQIELQSISDKLKTKYFTLKDKFNWEFIADSIISTPRTALKRRVTKETEVEINVNLDGRGQTSIHTGIAFFDHMLEQIGKHAGIDLSIQVKGDIEVDEHHTVEDTAITLGAALKEALGDKRGLKRYAFLLPMDESLIQCALDLSGRNFLVFEADFKREKIGGLPTELIPHFYRSLCEHLGANLNINIKGENEHHMVEGSFKALAKCLKQAISKEGSELPSTKGLL